MFYMVKGRYEYERNTARHGGERNESKAVSSR